MTRFYVESGDYKAVVRAEGAVVAAAKALSWLTPADKVGDKTLVSRRGFPSRRCGLATSDVLELETSSLLSLIASGEL